MVATNYNLRVRNWNLFGRANKFLEIQAQTGRSAMTGPLVYRLEEDTTWVLEVVNEARRLNRVG